jgi:hypothetical protein
MKSATWAAIIIVVNDVWSLAALALLIVGEITTAYLNAKKPKR